MENDCFFVHDIFLAFWAIDFNVHEINLAR